MININDKPKAMTKFYFLSVFFLLPFVLNAQSAIEFLETLNNEFRVLQYLQIDYLSNIVHRNGDDLQTKSLELKSAASAAIEKIAALPAPPNDNGLQKTALETFKGMGRMTEKNNKEQILKKAGCSECFALDELEYKEMKAASDEVGKTFSLLKKSIEEFAQKNNIKLVDNQDEFDLIISKVNRINDYLQLLNLCAAQPHYSSDNVVKLLNEIKINEAENAFKFFKKELRAAQKRHKSIGPIREDVVCLKKVEILLGFYQKMADEIFPQMLSAFDKKGEIIESSLNNYNNCIDKINLQLPLKVSDYEQAKTAVLQRNVPKPEKEIKG
jgi:predicted metal-dependent hydrolase